MSLFYLAASAVIQNCIGVPFLYLHLNVEQLFDVVTIAPYGVNVNKKNKIFSPFGDSKAKREPSCRTGGLSVVEVNISVNQIASWTDLGLHR